MSAADAAAGRATPFSFARPVLGAVITFFVLLMAAAGLKSWRDLQTARQREAYLLQRIEASDKNIQALRRRIDGLGRDPLLLEHAAREELGMVKPGDVVIVLPPEKPGAKPAALDSRATTM